MKYGIRRWISLFMTAVLILTGISTDIYAATGQAAQDLQLAGPIVKKMSASRLEELSGTEAVYFGTASAELTEADAFYSIPVYREGDLSEEASVSLLTLDVSALYGSDYELCLDSVYESGGDQTLLQKGGGQNSIVSYADSQASENGSGEDTDATQVADEESTEENTSGSGAGDITSSLLSEFGITEEELTQEMAEEAMSAENVDFSAGTVLHFAPGEDEKTITFRIMEDELEEGQEMFQFVLADAVGTTPRVQYTFTAVIDDNETLHDAILSFSAESYCSEDGKVTVTVNRTGSAYSMIDFYLQSVSDTAEAGVNYTEFTELLNMQPYQNSADYTFDVCGTGSMKVLLVPNTGCEVEGSDIAQVLISEEEDGTLYQASEEDGESGTQKRNFNLKIGSDSSKYFVSYTGNGPDQTIAGIYMKGYDQADPRVGDYVFVNNKTTNFGFHDGDKPTTWLSEYQSDDDGEKSRGFVYWFSKLASDEGESSMVTKQDSTFTLGTTNYRTITPNCEGKHWAGLHQRYEFFIESGLPGILGSRTLQWDAKGGGGGDFSKNVDSRFKFNILYLMDNAKIKLKAKAAERSKSISQVGLYVYGYVCMYKAFDVRMTGLSKLNYRTAGGSTLESIPFRIQMKAGVGHTMAADDYRTIYADTTGEQSKLTFSPSDVYLNGHSGVFGNITGYEMTYNCNKTTQDEFKTVKYPADFITFLKGKADKKETGHDEIDYTSAAVEKRIKKAQEDLRTIDFDKYFVDWLTSIELSLNKHDLYQGDTAKKLSFTPIFTYKPATVTVLTPEGSKPGKDPIGKFKELKVGTYEGTYHVGDTIDLTAEANAAEYAAAGFEYTIDGGQTWNTVIGENRLFLTVDMDEVQIRPLLTTDTNRIQFEFLDDTAKQVLEIQNLIPEDDLEDTPYEGMLLYDVNPLKSSEVLRARPKVGQSYQLSVLVKEQPKESGYVYRPYFIDTMYSSSKHLNSQVYPLIARAKEADNKIYIGVEKVAESELQERTITGLVQMKPLRYIRETGQEKKLTSVVGYHVMTASTQVTDEKGNVSVVMAETVTDESGKYTLQSLKAKDGDIIPVLVAGGYGGEYTGYVRVTGSASSIKADSTRISYPAQAPVVTSIMYSYSDPQHNIEWDTNQATIKLYQGDLDLQIVVDEKGHEIGNVYVYIKEYDGSISRYTATHKAGEKGKGETDVWTYTLEDLPTRVRPGARVYVAVEDKETMQIGPDKKVPIIYPTMDTGLTFLFSTDPVLPQYYEAKLDPDDDVPDIPLFGKGAQKSGATTGLINWESLQWPNGQGYTLSINVGVTINPLDPLAKQQKAANQEHFLKISEAGDIGNSAAQYLAAHGLPNEAAKKKDFKDLKEQIQAARMIRAAQAENKANPQADALEPYLSVSVSALISLYFVKIGSNYRYQAGTVVLAGTFNGDFTKFKMWAGTVPGYINFGFAIQVAWVGAWTLPSGQEGIDVNAFRKIDTNLKESIKGTSKTKETSGMVFVIITGYVEPGVGQKGVLSFKGSFDLTFNIGIPAPKTEGNKKTGLLTSVGGSVCLNTCFGDISINIVRYERGRGAWSEYKSWQVCGALIPTSPKIGEKTALTDELEALSELRDEKVLSVDGNEITSFVETLAGTASMEVFGKLSDGKVFDQSNNSRYAYPTTLLENAADYPRVQSVATSDEGNLFAVYIGNRGENGNEETNSANREALYYTTYQAASGSWSKPELVDDDGSFDTVPVLNFEETLMEDQVGASETRKVVKVTWSSAEDPWAEDISTLGKMSTLRIKTAEFIINDDGSAVPVDDSMIYLSGKKATASDAEKAGEEDPDAEKYYDVPINTWTLEDRVYSLFTRYDTSEIRKEEDIIDLTKTKPAVVLAEYDLAEKTLVRLDDLGLTCGNSILCSVDAEMIGVKGDCSAAEERYQSKDKVYLMLSYVLDTDGNLNTEKDTELKLCYVELIPSLSPFIYPAINISDGSAAGKGEHSISAPDITEIDGEYYLTYIKDGYQFEIAELSTYTVDMFAFDYLVNLYRGKVEGMDGGSEASSESWENVSNWYEVSVADLNKAWKDFYGQEGVWTEYWPKTQTELDALTKIPYPDPDYKGTDPIGDGLYFYPIFDGSVLKAVSQGEFETKATGFCVEKGQKMSIQEYALVEDQDDLYIIYTDYPEYRLAPEKELFCIKMNGMKDGCKDGDETLLTQPVQLTDARRVLDQFSATMQNGELVVLSNGYTQTIPAEGGIIFSENSLMETRYKPGSILRIDESALESAFAFDAEETGRESITVSYTVENLGLEPQQGYLTWVEDEDGNRVFEADMRTRGAEAEMDPEEECEGRIAESSGTETRLLYNSQKDTFTFSWLPKNYGVNQVLTVVAADASGKELDTIDLMIEEEKKREIWYAWAEDTRDGIFAHITVQNSGNVATEASKLILTHVDDEGKVLKTYATENVEALDPGESYEITMSFEPQNEDFNANGAVALRAAFEDDSDSMPFYYSPGDPSSLEIENGNDRIYMITRETRKLSASAQPLPEEAAEILYTSSDPSVVTVAEDGTVTAKKFGVATITAYNPRWALSDTIQVVVSSYSDSGSGKISNNLPSYVDKDGTWKQDENGNWTYTTKAGAKVKDKWIAIACATFGKGSGFEWFRFDKDGNMVTGWFRDSDDRMYYLQVVADGNKGRMLTGWQKIDKDWYYFEPVSNGYKGAMYRNQKTRDNYTVGNDGKWDGKPAEK